MPLLPPWKVSMTQKQMRQSLRAYFAAHYGKIPIADVIPLFSHNVFLVMASGKKGVHPPWTEIVASPSTFLDPRSLPPEALAPGTTLVFDNPGTISNAYLEVWVRHIRKLQHRYLMGESNVETFRWKSYSPGRGKEPVPSIYNETWMKGYVGDWASVVTQDELQSLLGPTDPAAPVAKASLANDITASTSDTVTSTSTQPVVARPQTSTPAPSSSTEVELATTIPTPATTSALQNAAVPSTTTRPQPPTAGNPPVATIHPQRPAPTLPPTTTTSLSVCASAPTSDSNVIPSPPTVTASRVDDVQENETLSPPVTTIHPQPTALTLPPTATTSVSVRASAPTSDRNIPPPPPTVTASHADDVQDIETSHILRGGGDVVDDEIGGVVPGSSQEGDDDRSVPRPTPRSPQSSNNSDPANAPLAPADSNMHEASFDEQDDLDDMIARIKEKDALKKHSNQVKQIPPSSVGPLPSDKLHFLSVLASDPQYQRLLDWFRQQQVSTSILLSLHRLTCDKCSHS